MASIPDFTQVEFAEAPVAAIDATGAAWLTPEGIRVKLLYAAADVRGLDFLDGFPGIPPYMSRGPGRYGNMPDFPPPRIRTLSTAAISPPGRRAFRWPSILQPTGATI